jgi:hypothetical protein
MKDTCAIQFKTSCVIFSDKSQTTKGKSNGTLRSNTTWYNHVRLSCNACNAEHGQHTSVQKIMWAWCVHTVAIDLDFVCMWARAIVTHWFRWWIINSSISTQWLRSYTLWVERELKKNITYREKVGESCLHKGQSAIWECCMGRVVKDLSLYIFRMGLGLGSYFIYF